MKDIRTTNDHISLNTNIPGAFSEGFNINVLPHVTAIGNICRDVPTSENKESAETIRLEIVMIDNLKWIIHLLYLMLNICLIYNIQLT